MRLLLPLFALTLAACSARPRLRPFTSDGCSLFPDGTLEERTLWLQCCRKHDFAYWRGGSKNERLRADLALRGCVAAAGRPKTASWMFRGTRAGGSPYLPTRFRWGYGWPYSRGYRPLTEFELGLIEESQAR